MRKIENEAKIEERKKRRGTYLTVFMLFILVVSTAGYAFLSGDKTTKNNAANGENPDGVKIGDQIYLLSNSRASVENISVDIKAGLSFYGGSQVYVSADSQTVSSEIFSTIGRYAAHIQNACYGNCSLNLPEKNCNDKLIVWNSSMENRVYQNESCVFIEGDMRAVDAFLYKVFSTT